MTDKFIWYSDLHLHPHGGDWNRVNDGLRILDWVREEANKRGIKTVIFGGDFFHVRERIFSLVFNRAYKKIKQMAEDGLEIYMLVGNHDMPLKNSTRHNNLSAFADLVHIIDDTYVLRGEEYNFFMLPYVENSDQLSWAISELAKRQDPAKKNALLAHLDVKSAWYNSTVQSEHGIDAANLSDQWDFVLSGHFHNFQVIGPKKNVVYSGTPLQVNFGDAGLEKGIVLFENGKLDFLPNDFSPKHIVVDEGAIDESVKGNFVRVNVQNVEEISNIRVQLEELGAASVDFNITNESFVSSEFAYVLEFKRDIDKLIQEWVNKNNFANLDKEKLLNVGRGIIAT